MQNTTFQTDDSLRCFDPAQRPAPPLPLHHHHHQQPRSIRGSCGCPRDCGLMGREYRPCIPDSNSMLLLLKMERGCSKGSEYGADNHDDAFLPFSIPKSRGTSTSLSNYNTSPNKEALLKSLPCPPPMTTQPSSHALYPSTLPLEGQDGACFESDSASKPSREEREDRRKSQCDDLLSLKFPKPSQRARLFEILLLLLVGAKRIKDVCDFCCCCGNECVDSGGSSSGQGSGGGSSSSGKKQQSNRSGSSSSSQRSGSGSSQRGGTGMGGRTHSGSSDSSDDNGDDDHNKRPRPPPNKEPKSKLDVSDDDDEETDSADEGPYNTPGSMTVDVSPQSLQNDNGGSINSQNERSGVKEQGGGAGRNIGNLGGLPLMSSGGGSGGGSGSRFSSVSSGATVEAITLKEGVAGGRITTSMLVSGSQISSPVNMAVGYGAPVLAGTENDTIMAPTSASIPGSELGTPTMDSPSPPTLGGEKLPAHPLQCHPKLLPLHRYSICNITGGGVISRLACRIFLSFPGPLQIVNRLMAVLSGGDGVSRLA